MQKWEYFQVTTIFANSNDMRIIPSKGKALFKDKGDEVPDFADYLDAIGKEGWEMINAEERDFSTYQQTHYYFKRPIE